VTSARLVAIDGAGNTVTLQKKAVGNTRHVTFDTRYDRFATSWLEVQLLDAQGTVLAKQRKLAR
jgi:hypothetical protein